MLGVGVVDPVGLVVDEVAGERVARVARAQPAVDASDQGERDTLDLQVAEACIAGSISSGVTPSLSLPTTTLRITVAWSHAARPAQ